MFYVICVSHTTPRDLRSSFAVDTSKPRWAGTLPRKRRFTLEGGSTTNQHQAMDISMGIFGWYSRMIFNRHVNHLDHLEVFTSKGSQIKRLPNWQKNYTQNKLRAEEGAEIKHYRSNMWTQPWHSFTVAIWVYERQWALVIFTEKAFQPVFYHTFRCLPTKKLNMNHHNSCFLCDISASIFHEAETIRPTITAGFTHWWQVHRSCCRFLWPR